jgi:hypothetical protein
LHPPAILPHDWVDGEFDSRPDADLLGAPRMRTATERTQSRSCKPLEENGLHQTAGAHHWRTDRAPPGHRSPRSPSRTWPGNPATPWALIAVEPGEARMHTETERTQPVLSK